MTQGERLHDAFTGQHLTFLESGRDTGGELLKLQVRLEPGGWVPRHVHARQDERVEVLAGALTIRVGGQERRLGVGDAAHVRRRKVHVLRNAGEDEAVFLLEVRPARRMEGFMRGMFALMKPLQPLARRRPSKGSD